MGIKKSKGIILRKYDLNEADRIVEIFTKKYGKISAIIKGIRKTKKRSQYGVDILVESDFIFYETNNRYTISSLELVDPYLKLKNSMDKINYSSYILNLVRSIVVEGEIREKLYDRTKKAFKYIENNRKSEYLIMIMFYISSLINEEGLGAYNDFSQIEENNIKINPNQKKVLKLLNKFDIAGINKLKLETNELIDIIKIFENIVNSYYDTKICIT